MYKLKATKINIEANKHAITNGYVQFFENYYILEINEGVSLNYNNSDDLNELILHYFGDGRPYGIISNRKNSYAIDLTDSKKFSEANSAAVAKAIVSYRDSSKHIVKLESHFCSLNKALFNSLSEAEAWIESEIDNAVKKRD
ncbi:hypothetical protein [Lacinutrix undariae]